MKLSVSAAEELERLARISQKIANAQTGELSLVYLKQTDLTLNPADSVDMIFIKALDEYCNAKEKQILNS